MNKNKINIQASFINPLKELIRLIKKKLIPHIIRENKHNKAKRKELPVSKNIPATCHFNIKGTPNGNPIIQ